MAYLGNIAANRFASTPATKRFSGDGSTTSFTLDTAASADQEILVSVDGVIQDSANYTVTGTTLDFGSGNAPSAGTNNIFVNYIARPIATVGHPSTSNLQAAAGTFTSTLDVTGATTLSSSLAMTSDDPTITMTDSSGTNDIATIQSTSGALIFTARDGSSDGEIIFKKTDGSATDESMRINASGQVLIGKSSADNTTAGAAFFGTTGASMVRDGGSPLILNRLSDDGDLLILRQASNTEGTISVSGTSVSYNGGHLSRYSQLTDNTRDNTIVKGTVMTNLDKMAEWTTEGVTEDNDQLNCMAVSSVEGDANVAGVFVNWDNDDKVYTSDMNVAMTGDMVIRIAKGTTVARGDLLMSAGDGTAKPQGDDIVRSKTIAKVTSTNVSHTYDDGTYLVPCVLMAC